MDVINAKQLPDDITDGKFKRWLVDQPEAIRQMGIRFPPNYLFLFIPTKQHVSVVGYNKNGTLNVEVIKEFNNVLTPFCHSSIAPKQLTKFLCWRKIKSKLGYYDAR